MLKKRQPIWNRREWKRVMKLKNSLKICIGLWTPQVQFLIYNKNERKYSFLPYEKCYNSGRHQSHAQRPDQSLEDITPHVKVVFRCLPCHLPFAHQVVNSIGEVGRGNDGRSDVLRKGAEDGSEHGDD